MRLVYTGTQTPVKVGDEVSSRDGERGVVNGFTKPHKPSSTGRVYVRFEGDKHSREFFPSVIGAEWIDREDHRAEHPVITHAQGRVIRSAVPRGWDKV